MQVDARVGVQEGRYAEVEVLRALGGEGLNSNEEPKHSCDHMLHFATSAFRTAHFRSYHSEAVSASHQVAPHDGDTTR
jgi:hypothetical protein